MRCPDEIADVLLQIVEAAVMNIRHFGNVGGAERCAIEAYHIHNLPNLIKDYTLALLKYYWEVERPCYIRDTAGRPTNFGGLWQALEPLVKRELQDAAV